MRARHAGIMRTAAAVSVLVVTIGACASGSTRRSGLADTTQSVTPSGYYGGPGPAPTSDLPAFCPPPWDALMPGWEGTGDGQPFPAVTWRTDLNGERCYGKDGPLRFCGDGYGDQDRGTVYSGSTIALDLPSDCDGVAPLGIRYAVPADVRRAGPDQLLRGMCFVDLDEAAATVVLTDCRRPHEGRSLWGRARERAGLDLGAVCDINRKVWAGFSETRLIERRGVYACLALSEPTADGTDGTA